MNLIIAATLLTVTHSQKLSSVLLKQAAEEILTAPFSPSPEVARLEVPRATDLLISRLQGELTLRVTDSWQDLTDPQKYQILQSKGAAKEILKRFKTLKTNVDDLEHRVNVETLQSTLNGLALESKDMSRWITFWDNFKRKVGQIAQLYNYFKGYVDSPDSTGDNTLRDFATSITKSTVAGRTMTSMLQEFHETIVEEKTFPYLHQILSKVIIKSSHIDTKLKCSNSQGETHLCTVTQSPQQLLYNLYNIVGLTEIKGHTMLQFSFMMLSIYDNDNYTAEAEAAKDKFVVEAKAKMRSLMSVLPNVSTEYHRCEPDRQVAGETYLEVTKLLQVILKYQPIKRN